MISIENMVNRLSKKILITLLLWCLLAGSIPVQAEMTTQDVASFSILSSDDIIKEGLQQIEIKQDSEQTSSECLKELELWFNQHPLIDYASLLGTSITVKFMDGSNIVLLDPFLEKQDVRGRFTRSFLQKSYGVGTSNTAVILNPAESTYGHYQCQKIIATLLRQDYSIEYVANQAVDLLYIKNNLSADIIYMNTHAGYFDVDGDHQAESVVIATGEIWTNETEQKYAYDYENSLIVKGMVGDQGIVAFTPAFIEHYYAQRPFPDSLVFMATCYALYDTTMGQAFLDAGAKVYVGWSENTVFWTNSRTSVQTFRLLSYGLTVQQVCRLIRSGGFYNWLLHSKLLYVGDGDYRIP